MGGAGGSAIGPSRRGTEIKTVGVIGAGQMGSGIAHVCALAGLDVRLNDISEDRINAGLATINGNMARQVSKGAITDAERQAALGRIRPAAAYEDFSELRHRHRGRDRERGGQAQDLRRALPGAAPGGDDRHQHLVDLDHPACRRDRPAGALHRHPLHEPGAGDAARRADPRHRHRATRPSNRQSSSSPGSARPRRSPRISRPSSSTASCCR